MAVDIEALRSTLGNYVNDEGSFDDYDCRRVFAALDELETARAELAGQFARALDKKRKTEVSRP